ncbi:alpha-1,4-glucan:maltose-1-phosphate maltosyltransferase [Methylobacter tundripaludum]|uniref:Alpha-1,4-glucan:maltose-1-phosphate maltosyltransferase n=1 Tax=Methylobacter tundripaludum TaxID=173365 RepID=A0A2S6H6I2_9GAMM|nr:alpha-1,4-glucan--maltose-1-phosphate maltosyltransferase [Methylobacter tundripaludum]PPK73006.1 alpha-1,4-glucan:maltose-1-phosphate maltosyltransferase [Methylobacter tundripaludum]
MKGTQKLDGRRRVVIENVQPEIDSGRFPIKRVIGQSVEVEADAFTDSHDALTCLLRYRHASETGWHEVAMTPLINDRWRASFPITELGRYVYTLTAWIDHFFSWRYEFSRRNDAQDIAVALQAGAMLVEAAATRADGKNQMQLQQIAEALRTVKPDAGSTLALSETLASLMRQHPDRSLATDYPGLLSVWSEPIKAQYSTWYEFFPRSCMGDDMDHGSFAECEKRLPSVAAMGFDVVYLPPIHPIGLTKRKGANNALTASETDVGSPWAIGAAEGGHKAIHPQLGTLDDFHRLVLKARELGIDVALDIAFQCSPDHPYVREHPEWFRHRADGSIQYAENPPKKYEDIVPFNFECDAWNELWQELLDIFLFWIKQGVYIFRVDNPHTKPFPFWEWLIAEVKRTHPETIFLAEAFTRPKITYRLAKLGFSQSYTYFSWRNAKSELETYFTELSRTEVREYFRPNLWPNTPDILPEYLQFGGRPAFMLRLVLAATLGANYGIYGPAYELMEAAPREAGGEEYLDSEKYQVRRWKLDRADSLQDFIARVNRIRRESPALQQDQSLQFFDASNDSLLCYAKTTADNAEIILVVANLDPHHTQSGWVTLPLELLGLDMDRTYQVQDLLTSARFLWNGARNYVEINPLVAPAHIFKLRRHVRTEHDFDYFL